MSFVSLVGDFSYVAFTGAGGAAIGALGTPWICKKFKDKTKPTDGLEAIPQFFLGGLAGGVAGLAFGIAAVREDNAANTPPETQIIELQEEGLPECDSNRYVVGSDGQIIACAFD